MEKKKKKKKDGSGEGSRKGRGWIRNGIFFFFFFISDQNSSEIQRTDQKRCEWDGCVGGVSRCGRERDRNRLRVKQMCAGLA